MTDGILVSRTDSTSESSCTTDPIDFAIITALQVERQAVCKAFGFRDEDRIAIESRVYWRGRLKTRGEKSYEIVVAQSPDMANIDAALLTNDTIHHWNPGSLLMVGIAGAVDDELRLGDIVAGSHVYYYERGKVTKKGKLPEPVMYPADATLWSRVSSVAAWTGRIFVPKPDERKGRRKARPKIYYGVIASGEKVVADKAFREEIKEGHRKILAIEMEGHGFSAAVWQSFEKKRHLVIRAISDQADRRKSDNWQPYAATVAAEFTKHFLLDSPLESMRDDTTPRTSVPSPKQIAIRKNKKIRADLYRKKQFIWDSFLSYSHKDMNWAERIHGALTARNLKIWRDVEQIKPGDLPVNAMEKGLENTASVIVLVSPEALRSGWVEEERSRAVSLSIDKGTRVIPVLIKGASVPGFLANRLFVDLNDESRFDQNMDLLVEGVRKKPGMKRAKGISPDERILARISFLWFFPEGLHKPAFQFLVSKMGVRTEIEEARQKGIVLDAEISGIEITSLAPGEVNRLSGYTENETKEVDILLNYIWEYLGATDPFSHIVQVGFGRAILLRDLLVLIDKSSNRLHENRNRQMREVARSLVEQIGKEGHIRVALEISNCLLESTQFPTDKDQLSHARLLLRVGEAARAADIYDIYIGDDLFADSGLSEFERILAGLDWAKACKDAGRGTKRHLAILKTYQQMLDLLASLMQESPDNDALRSLEADILNNRGTQIAVFGKPSEWTQSARDIKKATNTYREFSDEDSLLQAEANFVAHSLDRFDSLDTKPPSRVLNQLLNSLNLLAEIATKSVASENLFNLFYQKGRLLKRIHPGNPELCIPSYESAERVARQCNLTHRFPIAQGWVLRLRRQADTVSEKDYLKGLEECIASLRGGLEDAWAARALRNMLLDIAKVYRNENEMDLAWRSSLEAFEVQFSQFKRSTSDKERIQFVTILSVIDRFDEGLRTAFLKDKHQHLGVILGRKAWASIEWNDIRSWLTIHGGA